MNTLVENGIIKDMMFGSNLTYILNDENIFSSTEYKVLQSQAKSCFVNCMKTFYNGKIQLYYLTDSYQSLQSLLPNLNSDSFLTICSNLIANIIDVKSNGFLACQNIDISLEHIYIDSKTYQVCLIYLPISKRIFNDVASFENELRTSLIKLIQGVPTFNVPKLIEFSVNLAKGSVSLESLYTSIKSTKTNNISNNVISKPAKVSNESNTGTLKIVSLNMPTRVEIYVNKDEFVIGKKEEMVDGVITGNKMISRVHCKINRIGTEYTITDLQSANGTFVNNLKLEPNRTYKIKNGDRIRLANSDFQVIIN